MRDLTYLVMGAGALGSVFGGLLAEQGRKVSFVGLDDHLKAMQKKGLIIRGLWGEHVIPKVSAYYGTEDISETFDVVLLSVKSYHTATVIQSALPFMRDDTCVFSIQNGLGNWESIAEVVGWERTVGARVIFGAEIEEPGVARVTVYADKVLLGSPSGSAPKERIQEVCDDLNRSGVPTGLSDRIESSLWGKVLYNCALNALGAVLNVPYGSLNEAPELRETMRGIINEIFSVARAKGVALPYPGPEEYYRFLLEKQLPPTAAHRSSMLQDLDRGRPTEIDALNGAIARYGRDLQVPVPVNETITAIVKGLELKTQGKG